MTIRNGRALLAFCFCLSCCAALSGCAGGASGSGESGGPQPATTPPADASGGGSAATGTSARAETAGSAAGTSNPDGSAKPGFQSTAETGPDGGTGGKKGGPQGEDPASKTAGASGDPPKTADAGQPKNGQSKKGEPKKRDPRLSSRFFRPNRDGVETISFDDLNIRIEADIVFRPFMLSERAKSLDGKRVRITGYMLAGDRIKGIREFVLLKNTECKFGPGGQADHLASVKLRRGVKTHYRLNPISVEGVLKVKPFRGPDGNTWSIYDLVDVSEVQDARR